MFFSLFIDFYKYNVSVISFRWQIVQIKSIKTSLNLLYYVEGWSEFVGPIFSSLHPIITVSSKKKCRSGGEPFTKLSPIWPTRDFSF